MRAGRVRQWMPFVVVVTMSGGIAHASQQPPDPATQKPPDPATQKPANPAAQKPEPPPSSYRLGPEDSFIVRGLNVEEIGDRPFRLDSQGRVTLPMVGQLKAGGLTTNELETELNERLKKYIKSPAVSVTIAEVHNNPIAIIGAVNASAVYQAPGSKTLIEMLSLAGGVRNDAGEILIVTRPVASGPLPLANAQLDPSGQYWLARVNVKTLLSGERPQDNIRLQVHDVVSVQKADMVYVIGDVNRAGAIPLTGKMTLTQALARSEGLQKSASQKQIRILRDTTGDGTKEEIAVDFQKVLNGKAPDRDLLPNDVIVIPTNVSRHVALRTLETALQIGVGLIIWN